MVTVTKVRPYVPKLYDSIQSEALCAQGLVSYTHPVYPVNPVVFLQMQAIWSFVAREADRKTLSSCVRNHERLWSIGLTWSTQPVETKELGAKNAHTNAASLWKKGEKKTLKCWRQQYGHCSQIFVSYTIRTWSVFPGLEVYLSSQLWNYFSVQPENTSAQAKAN